jgi:hypothetical protein
MKLLCTKFEGLTQATRVQKIKFVGLVVFEKKRLEAKIDVNAYAYVHKRPCVTGQKKKFFCP